MSNQRFHLAISAYEYRFACYGVGSLLHAIDDSAAKKRSGQRQVLVRFSYSRDMAVKDPERLFFRPSHCGGFSARKHGYFIVRIQLAASFGDFVTSGPVGASPCDFQIDYEVTSCRGVHFIAFSINPIPKGLRKTRTIAGQEFQRVSARYNARMFFV
jgi:hypothetical protein